MNADCTPQQQGLQSSQELEQRTIESCKKQKNKAVIRYHHTHTQKLDPKEHITPPFEGKHNV